MGLRIDNDTTLLFTNDSWDATTVALYCSKWEKTVPSYDITSQGPENQLVMHDICTAPLEIIRDSEYGKLWLRADIKKRAEEDKERLERSYTAIILAPERGRIGAVARIDDGTSISFNMRQATATYVLFDGIKNRDLAMKIYYQSIQEGGD